jgi:hypothetical protein
VPPKAEAEAACVARAAAAIAEAEESRRPVGEGAANADPENADEGEGAAKADPTDGNLTCEPESERRAGLSRPTEEFDRAWSGEEPIGERTSRLVR